LRSSPSRLRKKERDHTASLTSNPLGVPNAHSGLGKKKRGKEQQQEGYSLGPGKAGTEEMKENEEKKERVYLTSPFLVVWGNCDERRKKIFRKAQGMRREDKGALPLPATYQETDQVGVISGGPGHYACINRRG